MKTCFLRHSWIKGCRQIDEIKQSRFSYAFFYNLFFAIFYQKNVKIWLLGSRLGSRHEI